MVRLWQITPALARGGVEQRIARVLAGLSRSEYELGWIGFTEANEGLIASAGEGVKTRSLKKSAGGVDWGLVLRTARVLKREGADMVHVHNWSTSIYGIAGAHLAGVKHVIYGVGGREQAEGASARQRAVMRVLAPYVDRFTTVCDFLADEIAREWGLPRSRIEVIRTGIDLARFSSSEGARQEARKRLALPEDATVVGALTVLRPVKRVEDLIAAAGRVAREDPRIHVVLLGTIVTVSAETIRGWAREAGLGERITITGRVDDPEKLLPAFDVYVNCSIFEGASNAIMEAMASGLPVIATRVGGTPELARDGDNALLVEPLDVDALADAIARLANDPALRRRLGERARSEAHARFGTERMLREYAALYRRVSEAPARSIALRSARAAAGVAEGLALLAKQYRSA